MAFFEDWRLQMSMMGLLDESVSRGIQYMEQLYAEGDDSTRNEIHTEYLNYTRSCRRAWRRNKENIPPADAS